MSDALVLRADAGALPLPDASVDLIVTSPPYFGQRSYKDDGEHYGGQIGSEPTPQEFLAALWTVTAECWRVLKPPGSMFVNLGDKRSGSGAPGTTSGLGGEPQGDRVGYTKSPQNRNDSHREGEKRSGGSYTKAAFGRPKSKQLLPHRYAIGCEDGAADPEGIGWIVRQDLVWSKPNGLPESVRDRTRDAHEYWFHLVKQGNYFSGVDEIREPSKPQDGLAGTFRRPNPSHDLAPDQAATQHRPDRPDVAAYSPLGALPRSVWEIATEPLKVPAHLGVDHFAAFPSEWPRRLILGWSPPAICLECGEGRRPTTTTTYTKLWNHDVDKTARNPDNNLESFSAKGRGFNEHAITGYVCACTPYTDHPERRRKDNNPTSGVRVSGMTGGAQEWADRQAADPGPVREYDLAGWTPPPSRPAVVLDPFGGTGTTAMVARALGRFGISVDLSADYCRLARWRIFESGHGARSVERTNRDRQGVLL